MNNKSRLRTLIKHIPEVIRWVFVGLMALIVLVFSPQEFLEGAVFLVVALVVIWVLTRKGVMFGLLFLLLRYGIVFGFGIVVLLGSLLIPAEFLLTRFTGNQTTGTVVEVFRVRFDDAYRIAFNDSTGARQVFTDVESFARPYTLGQELTIAYLPGDDSGLFNAVVVRPLLPDELPLVILTPIMLLIGRWITLVGWRAWREPKTKATESVTSETSAK
jgi:hypothetical protein